MSDQVAQACASNQAGEERGGGHGREVTQTGGREPLERVFLVGILLSWEGRTSVDRQSCPFCLDKTQGWDKKDSVLQWRVTVFTEPKNEMTRKRPKVPELLNKEIWASSRGKSYRGEP